MIPCGWFAYCENAAEVLLPHPILGNVPTCLRCANRAENAETPRTPLRAEDIAPPMPTHGERVQDAGYPLDDPKGHSVP